jgi:two-component system OmpR family response regulator
LTSRTVLIVDDEENLTEAIKYNLEQEGFQVSTAADGERGLAMAREFDPDLIILDIMLPSVDGLEVCRTLRRRSDVPILMLTAKAEEIDRVVGLELGADDYVVKPFSMRELVARAKAMLRRTPARHSESAQVLVDGDLELNLTSHEVTLRDVSLELKPREFDLLALLMQNRSRIYTRNQILDQVWGYDFVGDMRTVDVHVRWLREKIEDDPGSPKRIVTVRGVGYRFQG